MTYALSVPLQTAIFARLQGDADLTALGLQVIDAAPVGRPPPLYVSLGAEEVRDRSDKTARAAEHRFTLSVISEQPGFSEAKVAAAAIDAALTGSALSLSRGRVVNLTFERAQARRVQEGKRRRIDLQYRAILDDI